MIIKSILSFILLQLLSLGLNAQVEVKDRILDFDIIERGSQRVLETQIVNQGLQKAFLLRTVTSSKEFDIKTDKLELATGDSLRVRVKLNPIREGRKREDLELIFGKETVRIQLKAEVRYVDPADNTPCPDFAKDKNSSSSDWTAYFKVINRDTKEAIKDADILLTGMSGVAIRERTDKKGELTIEMPIDYYTIKASKTGFAKYSLESYINRRNKDFILELMPGKMGSVVVMRAGSKDKDQPIKQEEVTETAVDIEISKPSEPEQEPEFSLDEYRANNVVFLVDISTSMRQEDRIGLLKSSMIELARMLRPNDVISIVTYATSTDVVLSGEQVRDSERLEDIINALEAEGKTAGEAGLRQAYSLCKKYYLEKGNNQVYIATDGAFNRGSEKVKKMIKSRAKRGMNLSVLSIRSSKWVDKKMQELAQAGQGMHLSLQEEADRIKLKELIKAQSKR